MCLCLCICLGGFSSAQLKADRSPLPLFFFFMDLQFCLLASAAFHLFLPHISEKTSMRWLQLDLLGITFGILGCYVPGVHFGFYCYQVCLRLYACVCVL